VPTDVRLSPDGQRVAFVVKETAPARDGYRQSIHLAPFDGSAPARRLTLGARRDVAPRWSPDGRWLAFLSDRGAVLRAGGAPRDALDLEVAGAAPVGSRDAAGRDIERGATQVWLLPLDGGEAHQLTDLPEDVADLAWSPDGSRLCVVSAARTATRSPQPLRPSARSRRDVRLIDELAYQLNGIGFTHDRPPKLWVVEVATGAARQLTSGPRPDEQPSWSPDGRRVCFVSNRSPAPDLVWRSDLYVVDVDPVDARPTRPVRISGGRERVFRHPSWSPDGRLVAAVGHRIGAGGMSRDDVWVFEPDGAGLGHDLTASSDLYVGGPMNSDVLDFVDVAPTWDAASEALVFVAPIDGSNEAWRVRVSDGRVERLTSGQHYLSRVDARSVGRGQRLVGVLAGPDRLPDVVAGEVSRLGRRGAAPTPSERLRRLTHLVPDATSIELSAPEARWHESDGRRIQGWFYEAPPLADGRPAPVVLEIHGGPATLYGWAPTWEWQVLRARGISVFACNPRGSVGYGEAFAHANHGDWREGPTRDVLSGLDALAAEGRIDPERMGVTGGSYGGYLTAWIIGHTDRFGAAVSCRGVYDLTSQMLSGDIGGPLFGRYEFGVQPWEDPDVYRRASPIAYAQDIRTPLLIQHAEQDLRCPITQAEELFAVLRSLRRPVRLMRTPGETHELTRSGTPFRRVENLEHIADWFAHFLVEGGTGLPPVRS
jgi:dipeptidyl aminopeptidase/acylaminoacyl peptidase